MALTVTAPPCELLHEPTAEYGWETAVVLFNERPHTQHLLPCGDLHAHRLDPSCWCCPVEDEEAAGFWIHNSADGREAYETGKRAAN